MSKPLTDAEALAHYRDELNRTRRAIQDLADEMGAGGFWFISAATVETALLRILGARP